MEKARQHTALIAAGLALAAGAVLVALLAAPRLTAPVHRSESAAPANLAVPTGIEVSRIEVIYDTDLQAGRFRFLAPQIAAPGFDFEALAPVFDWLCETIAAPELRAAHPDWDEVVISLSSVSIPFGTSDPEVIQAFEGYRVEAAGCIWEQF